MHEGGGGSEVMSKICSPSDIVDVGVVSKVSCKG